MRSSSPGQKGSSAGRSSSTSGEERSAGGRSGARRRAARGRSRFSSLVPSTKSYAAAEAVTVGAIATYDVIGSDTKLPRPGPIVAALGFYAMLAAAGAASRTFEPVAVAIAWVLALSVLVTGRRGAGLLRVLRDFTSWTGRLGGDNTQTAGGGS